MVNAMGLPVTPTSFSSVRYEALHLRSSFEWMFLLSYIDIE